MCRRSKLCGCHNGTEQRWFKKCQNVLRAITHSARYHSNKHIKKKKKKDLRDVQHFFFHCPYSNNDVKRESKCYIQEDTYWRHFLVSNRRHSESVAASCGLVVAVRLPCRFDTHTWAPLHCTDQLSTIQWNTNHSDYSLNWMSMFYFIFFLKKNILWFQLLKRENDLLSFLL